MDALTPPGTVAAPAAHAHPPDTVRFDGRGPVPVIARMDRGTVDETPATGHATYFSRRRGTLWRKGETGGRVQRPVEPHLDRDGDTPPGPVDRLGMACHTGRRNCFFHAPRKG